MNFSSSIKPLTFLVLATLAHQSFASGYHFGTQSVSAQSTANSAAAEAVDSSTLFYNPAGLTQLEQSEVSVNANVVLPSIKYETISSKNFLGNRDVVGSSSGKITKTTVAPHIYSAAKLNDQVTVGLGVYVPFGSASEYEKDSNLRMHLNQLSLKTIAIEPAIAFKANEQHSFGVGVVGQYAEAELRKGADWSLSLANGLSARARAAAQAGDMATAQALATQAGAVLGNPAAEGYADVKGKDWGVGYHAGWLYNINDKARVGVNYRSKVEHKLKGTAEWNASGAISEQARTLFSQSGYVPSEDADVKIITPESASVHGMVQATDKLKLFGDVTWTRHSRFNTAQLNFANEKSTISGERSSSTTITPNWRNTYRVAVGGAYQVNEQLQLRAGVAFDKSPVRHAGDRMNTLPDGNRVWFSAGVKYNINPNHTLDFAYSHIHINDTEFHAKAASGRDVDSKGAASAKFKNSANILGAQYTYRF